jgi:DNA-directed RNA polymerase specialized sigma24 family protein
MERSTALRLLPAAHARAIELAARGVESPELAARLGVDISAVGPLLQVARAKLAALEALEEAAGSDNEHVSDILSPHSQGREDPNR